MICPACRQEMIVVEYKKIELDVCAFCRGLWFDAEELGLLLGSLKLPADELGRSLTAKTREAARKCPYCRSKMEKTLMGLGEGVTIDRCKKGHGLWFDGGELDEVICGLLQEAEARGGGKAAGRMGSFLMEVLLADKEDAAATDRDKNRKK